MCELTYAVQETFHFFDKKIQSPGSIFVVPEPNTNLIRSLILNASVEWGMSGGRIVRSDTNEIIGLICGGWAHENRNIAFPLCHPYVGIYLKQKYNVTI